MSLRISLHSRWVLLSLIAVLITPDWVSADAARVIELSDGSRISGVIIDYGNGTYTIQSETLGRLQLRDAQIRSIHSPSQTSERAESLAPASPDPATLSQLEHIQSRIMAEPELLSLVVTTTGPRHYRYTQRPTNYAGYHVGADHYPAEPSKIPPDGDQSGHSGDYADAQSVIIRMRSSLPSLGKHCKNS